MHAAADEKLIFEVDVTLHFSLTQTVWEKFADMQSSTPVFVRLQGQVKLVGMQNLKFQR